MTEKFLNIKSKFKKPLNYIKGFSLVEVMVAVGLVSIFGYIVVDSFLNGLKQQVGVTRKYERNYFESQLRLILGTPTLCNCNLGGQTLTPGVGAPPFSIVNLKSNCASTINDFYIANASGYKIDSTLAISWIRISDVVQVVGDEYLGKVTVRYQNIGPAGPVLKDSDFLMSITRVPASSLTIASCSLGSASPTGTMSGSCILEQKYTCGAPNAAPTGPGSVVTFVSAPAIQVGSDCGCNTGYTRIQVSRVLSPVYCLGTLPTYDGYGNPAGTTTALKSTGMMDATTTYSCVAN